MASIALDTSPRGNAVAADQRFTATLAVTMAVVVVAGFSTQLAMGRSSFGSPLRVHIHAIVFMGWVALFVAQSWLATRGPLALHRKLGWIAVGWLALMVTTALTVIVVAARGGTVPFFFAPQRFVISNPASILCFVALTGSAIMRRRETDWHARLHVCGMASIMGPAFGRLLPMPLLIPWAFECALAAGLVFPLVGALRDRRALGRAHPAWWWGIGAIVATMVLSNLVALSPLGDAIYAGVTADSPGAAVPGLAYPPPPNTPLLTGR